MGWINSHLWEFTIGEQRYGLPQAKGGWGDTPAIDASKTLLRDVLIPRSTVIDCLYDFGDSWESRLFRPQRANQPRAIGQFEKILASDQSAER